MALPYTDSPLGSMLALLGQGIPALAQAHRQRDIQDAALALQKQEAESRLKTEGLQQQDVTERLAYRPTERARQTFEFANQVDPFSAWQNRTALKNAGVELPNDQYVPPQVVNSAKQEAFKGGMLDDMLNTLRQSATKNGPTTGPMQGTVGGPADNSANPLSGLSFMRRMRMAGLLNGPETPQEAAEVEAAKKTASMQAENAMGQLPQKDDDFVQSAMDYYTQLQNARNLLNDPRVQKGGYPAMQFERMKYNMGWGNSAPYDQIIPGTDMSKQLVLTQLANGIRNATTRAAIGQHLASSDNSPTGMTQRIDNILKYYPYMVYSRYATRGSVMPDRVAQGLGFQNAAALKSYADQLDATKPASVGQGFVNGQDPLVAKYAQQFGLTYEQAAQHAAASGYRGQ